MKSPTGTIARTIALAALVCIASLAPALHAQALQARFNVPFSFDCGRSHLAAGIYTITVEDNGIVVLRQGSYAVMALTRMGYAPKAPSADVATFRKYGDRYFLTEIATTGNLEVSVLESSAEKHAVRELASRGETGSQIALALLPPGLNRASR